MKKIILTLMLGTIVVSAESTILNVVGGIISPYYNTYKVYKMVDKSIDNKREYELKEKEKELYDKEMKILEKENCSLQEREVNHFVMNCTKKKKHNLFSLNEY